MKNMFSLIVKCTHTFENLLQEEVGNSDIIESNRLMSSFTLDCVGSCAFGVEMNVMQKDIIDNPYRKLADLVFESSKCRGYKNTVRSIWPSVFYAFGFKCFPPDIKDSLLKLVSSVMQTRQYKPSLRNDFVDLILSLVEKGSSLTGDSLVNPKTGEPGKIHLTLDEEVIAGVCAALFAGAFETSATTLTLTLFEIAKDEDVQQRAYSEVEEYLEKHDGKLNYDCVYDLPYLNACVSESLHLHPVFGTITREVMEDYVLPTGLKLDKGVRLHIPVYHMHMNPKNFPGPEKFCPERFYVEAKENIKSFAYLPFGEGPRMCIGIKFSKMQVMAGLVTGLKNYKVGLAEGMPKTVEFDPCVIVSHTVGDVNPKYSPRKKHVPLNHQDLI